MAAMTRIPPRVPQAERSATTRTKVIEAAIDCLYRLGYGSTGFAAVAKSAEVSLGAITHQFPSKADLMVAVVEHVYDEDMRLYREAAEQMSAREFLRALPEVVWRVLSRPAAVASVEIMQAARSDEELGKRARLLQQGIEARSRDALVQRFATADVPLPDDLEAIQHLVVGSVRGLALEAVYMNNRDTCERSVALLSKLIRDLVPEDRANLVAAYYIRGTSNFSDNLQS